MVIDLAWAILILHKLVCYSTEQAKRQRDYLKGYIGWICGRPCQIMGFVMFILPGGVGLTWEPVPKLVEELRQLIAILVMFGLYPYFISIFPPHWSCYN